MGFFSTHTGANGAGLGATSAGLIDVGGVEIDDYCADLYRQNFGHGYNLFHQSILDINLKELPNFDFLWSSPPCQNHSVAKYKGQETLEDVNQARKIIEIIKQRRPLRFALENVRGYYKSAALTEILESLHNCGYYVDLQIVDAANFGVPQNRRRLILRASTKRLSALVPTHDKEGLEGKYFWQGWYSAIADLLPNCKQTTLNKKQQEAWEAFQNHKSSPLNKPVSIALIERNGYGLRNPTIRQEHQPAHTVRASGGCDQKGSFRSPVTAVDGVGVYALDYRCLARLQTFPDEYLWGSRNGLNCKAIGNAVPPLLAQRVIESLIDDL